MPTDNPALADKIRDIIASQAEKAQTTISYRKPLIGFASAQDPLFTEMKEVIGPHHLHPTELLPEALKKKKPLPGRDRGFTHKSVELC